MQAKLHNVDMVAKNLRSENEMLKRNLNAMVKNAILVSLRVSPLKILGLEKATGVNEKELMPFINDLLKDKKIKKDNEIYSLVLK